MYVDQRDYKYPLTQALEKGAPPNGVQPFIFPKYSSNGFVYVIAKDGPREPLGDRSAARAAEPAPLWEAGLLGFTASQNAYPGASERTQKTLVLPWLIYRGPVLRADRGSVGLRAVKTPEFELDVGFAAALGASSERVRARSGTRTPQRGASRHQPLPDAGRCRAPRCRALGDAVTTNRDYRRVLADLPGNYLAWFAREGFPRGELGRLLALMLEIDHNGLKPLLEPLRQGRAPAAPR